mmetsp:Transcript_54442/g.115633  ORF Transcript_54442/g.115633 Transcript_54442/m.115633 type:complete len:185 (-) Transcript_54442:167-721(-)
MRLWRKIILSATFLGSLIHGHSIGFVDSFSAATRDKRGPPRTPFGLVPKMAAANNIQDDPNNDTPSFALKQRNPYDVHVYYDGPKQREEAMTLREKMQSQFQWMRFFPYRDRPIGPHPVPMWEADFGGYENRHRWTEVHDFVAAEHGNLSVLIHPHSEDGDYMDHTKHAFWAGEVLDLRLEILR